MKIFNALAVLMLFAGFAWILDGFSKEEPVAFIARDGKPAAEIVIAPERPRMVTLAALELRHYIEKMTGTHLAIVTEPGTNLPFKIYVGKSAHTDKLGIMARPGSPQADEGLKDGAFRIVSGQDWLVLAGRDRDFDYSGLPWPLKRNDIPRAAAEWEKATEGKTDTAWDFPFAAGFKGFWNPKDFNEIMSKQYGDDFGALWKQEKGVSAGFWNEDESGSLNAVCEFLRRLGVRWYMAGDIGEVVPNKPSIFIEPCDDTVKPDFPLRMYYWYNYSMFSFDDVIWARRLGMNSGHEQLGPARGPHGLVHVHGTGAMQKAHPDYYALIGGKRDTEHRKHGTACFTSGGLEKETVNYIRFLFDKYDLPSTDIWPGDGLKLCQCEGCKGKTASELVWGFADRVAREVYKTHPKKRITCGAYTSYKDAPDNIDKFSPNLCVWITNCGRPRMVDPEHWAEYRARVQKWQSKMAPGNIMRTENNRYHIWDKEAKDKLSFPVIHPRAVAKDLKALNGISLGDSGEQSQAGGKWFTPGHEHITLYIQSRFLWDANQDVEKVLEEYFTLFYGPAANQMKEALSFAENNLAVKDASRKGKGDPRNVPLAVSLRYRELLEKARQAAGDTVYGRRIQLVISELRPGEEIIAEHRRKESALAEERARAPVAVGVEGPGLEKAAVCKLKDNKTGEEPPVETTFRAGWDKNTIIFDITCKDPDMKGLNVSTDVNSGDHVAVFLETPSHSYYHIAVNPEGALAEGNPGQGWKSLAEVKTWRGADSWRVQLMIPVVGDKEAEADPNHRVAGARPAAEAPWYFNVCRQRVRGGQQTELQAFSPAKFGWHAPEKFARLEIK